MQGLSPHHRGTRCSSARVLSPSTLTCSRGFPVAAPKTPVCPAPLRHGPARHHPRLCNGSPAQSLTSSQLADLAV